MGSRAFVERGPLPGRFVEVHVEQGPVLERAGAPLGVVTGIVGYTRREVVFAGAAGHAGTTPMAARDDALSKAAEFILRVRDSTAGIDGAGSSGRTTPIPSPPSMSEDGANATPMFCATAGRRSRASAPPTSCTPRKR